MAPAGFEHGDKAVTIGPDAGDGIVDRRAHAGLRRQMHDAIGRDLVEDARHGGEVCEIDLVEFEPWMVFERCETRTLQRGIVIRSDCIDADDLLATCQQPFTNMHSDKAGSAGNDHWPQSCHLVHSAEHCQTRT